MKYDVVLKIKDEDKESGECICRFWEAIGQLIENQWKKHMMGELDVENIKIDGVS